VYATERRIYEKNPGLDLLFNMNHILRMKDLFPQPAVANPGAIFSIVNLIDIEMLGEEGITLLKGEKDKIITRLFHDGTYLYALRVDGKVVQWNPMKCTCITFETALSQNDPLTLKHRSQPGFNSLTAGMDNFFIKEGFIFIRYVDFVEVIEMDSKTSFKMNDEGVAQLPRCQIQDKKLYMVGSRRMLVWNLDSQSIGSKGQEITGDLEQLSPDIFEELKFSRGDLFFGKKTIFVYHRFEDPEIVASNWIALDRAISPFLFSGEEQELLPIRNPHKTQVFQFNLSDGKMVKKVELEQDGYAGCLVLGDLLITGNYDPGTPSGKPEDRKFIAFNMRTGKKIGEIDVFDPTGRIQPTALAQLVALCKNNYELLTAENSGKVQEIAEKKLRD
jgi:hypothetical protein